MSEIGVEVKKSIAVAKTLALAKCGHEEGKEASAANCLKSLVGEKNREHYVVGTQDRHLREQLERIPGAPAMFLTAHGLTMEAPSALHKVTVPPPQRHVGGQVSAPSLASRILRNGSVVSDARRGRPRGSRRSRGPWRTTRRGTGRCGRRWRQ